MRLKINAEEVFFVAMVAALIIGQPFLALLMFLFLLTWEDAKWPAFDADDYGKKKMNGPLKPWKKGI